MVSLNCHGFNVGSENYLRKLCVDVDVLLLQETWLSDCSSHRLKCISDEFVYYHSSAMEDKICNNFMSGRPFGGTAVLIHKRLAGACRRVVTDNPRITAICLSLEGNVDVIISSVYMPWCDRSVDHVVEYQASVPPNGRPDIKYYR